VCFRRTRPASCGAFLRVYRTRLFGVDRKTGPLTSAAWLSAHTLAHPQRTPGGLLTFSLTCPTPQPVSQLVGLAYLDSQGPGSMPNRHRFLIVDDDPGLRDGLTEQLSLHEEFEAVTVENGIKGVQASVSNRVPVITPPSHFALPCSCSHSCAASPVRSQRGHHVHHRPLYVPAKLEVAR
jgi:hypothetical protein